MNYISTRNKNIKISSAQAIKQGISEEGGLFVPDRIPSFTIDEICSMTDMSYNERAFFVLSKYLTDFSKDQLSYCTNNAYTNEKFSDCKIAPVVELEKGFNILELWHGPTCAFKDMALQILPFFLTASIKITDEDKTVCILVATSGDTGKAALEGFKNVEGTNILVFYPELGVSNMQKLQMKTQEGNNVNVFAIKGNFDDAQSGVKKIFIDENIKDELEKRGYMFSSANSINFGRLCPQIVYYFSAYCDLIEKNKIKPGQEINVVVPTGNFGNILAAYYAKLSGLPIKKLICASNKNKVLTDFINTGIYNKNREFFATSSPSMDILISSNLERLLFSLYENDDKEVLSLMKQLSEKGEYKVSDKVLKKLQESFAGGFANEEETFNTIKYIFDKYGYICDTHTAVAIKVYLDYKEKTKDDTVSVIASTASPYKFPDNVLKAVLGEKADLNDFELIKKLSDVTKTEIPAPIKELESKKVRFNNVIDKTEMKKAVLDLLK